MIKSAVEHAVSDPAIRKWLLSPNPGPYASVAKRHGVLIAWGCQAHNCGRNWALVIRPDGSDAQVCYQDGFDLPVRWFAAGKLLARKDDCPADVER